MSLLTRASNHQSLRITTRPFSICVVHEHCFRRFTLSSALHAWSTHSILAHFTKLNYTFLFIRLFSTAHVSFTSTTLQCQTYRRSVLRGETRPQTFRELHHKKKTKQSLLHRNLLNTQKYVNYNFRFDIRAGL